MKHTTDQQPAAASTFSTDTAGLVDAVAPAVVELGPGEKFELRIAPVSKMLGDDRVRMLSYNGSIPGPTLRVQQGSEITVDVRNDGDVEATVHWHGLRLDNKYDGVPFETQAPIPVGGGEFTYRLTFPDAGLYWYHPHIREDYGLDMGLYGNIVVVPEDADYWPPVNRDVVITLDDVLVEDGSIVAFNESGPTHVAMGRFGNVMLTGGETNLELVAQKGEVVRFYFTNTANTRLFNVALPGSRMKLVGSDSGRYEHETIVEEVLLAPSERAIIDVLFDTPGSFAIQHRTPGHTYVLGSVVVRDQVATPSFVNEFERLRTSRELSAERARLDADLERAPDKTLAFKSLMPLLYGGRRARNRKGVDLSDAPGSRARRTGNVSELRDEARRRRRRRRACPMHLEVTAEPGTCPKCGMKLVRVRRRRRAAARCGDGHTHVRRPTASSGKT